MKKSLKFKIKLEPRIYVGLESLNIPKDTIVQITGGPVKKDGDSNIGDILSRTNNNVIPFRFLQSSTGRFLQGYLDNKNTGTYVFKILHNKKLEDYNFIGF